MSKSKVISILKTWIIHCRKAPIEAPKDISIPPKESTDHYYMNITLYQTKRITQFLTYQIMHHLLEEDLIVSWKHVQYTASQDRSLTLESLYKYDGIFSSTTTKKQEEIER